MNELINFIRTQLPRVWNLLWNQKILAYFLTCEIINAYLVPSIRKLMGKD